jgi:hypothetical protein
MRIVDNGMCVSSSMRSTEVVPQTSPPSPSRLSIMFKLRSRVKHTTLVYALVVASDPKVLITFVQITSVPIKLLRYPSGTTSS